MNTTPESVPALFATFAVGVLIAYVIAFRKAEQIRKKEGPEALDGRPLLKAVYGHIVTGIAVVPGSLALLAAAWAFALFSPAGQRLWAGFLAGPQTTAAQIASPDLSLLDPDAPSVDVKVNGSDGPLRIRDHGYAVTWSALHATACEMTSPVQTGISTFGQEAAMPGNMFYPEPGVRMVFQVNCTDGVRTTTDSVVVQRATAWAAIDLVLLQVAAGTCILTWCAFMFRVARLTPRHTKPHYLAGPANAGA